MQKQGILLSRASTSGWAQPTHGDLWLFPDGILRIPLGFVQTLSLIGYFYSYKPNEHHTISIDDVEFNRLCSLPNALWIPQDLVARAKLQHLLGSDTLTLTDPKGKKISLRWTANKYVWQLLEQAIYNWSRGIPSSTYSGILLNQSSYLPTGLPPMAQPGYPSPVGQQGFQPQYGQVGYSPVMGQPGNPLYYGQPGYPPLPVKIPLSISNPFALPGMWLGIFSIILVVAFFLFDRYIFSFWTALGLYCSIRGLIIAFKSPTGAGSVQAIVGLLLNGIVLLVSLALYMLAHTL
jgi:hypothetical protein